MRDVDFITTANAMVGMGHLRRCLTLSDELHARGVKVRYFIFAVDPGVQVWMDGRVPEVEKNFVFSFSEALARAEAPIVIVDTYDVASADLRALVHRGSKVLLIDDLAAREMPVTWVLNSCMEDPLSFKKLTEAQLLLGPSYALLRSQFRSLPCREVGKVVNNVLLTFGGSDVAGLNSRILRVMEAYPAPLHIRMVEGLLAPPLKAACSRHRIEVSRNADNMAELMTWADMAVATAGQTIFELAAAGCPALCVQVVDNQCHTGKLFADVGSAVVRDARTTSDNELAEIIQSMAGDVVWRQAMSRAGQAAVDGRGAGRVASVLQADWIKSYEGS